MDDTNPQPHPATLADPPPAGQTARYRLADPIAFAALLQAAQDGRATDPGRQRPALHVLVTTDGGTDVGTDVGTAR